MTTTPTSVRRRRLAGLSGLLAAIGLLVAARAAVSTPQEGNQMALLPAAPPAGAAQQPAATTAPAGGGAGAAPTTGAAHPATGQQTVNGDVVDTPFGPVQVAVVFNNGKITDVQALQTPADANRSIMLAQYATPVLRQEVLAAQSANVNAVSGATYTSEGYAQSVQYAIDHAAH